MKNNAKNLVQLILLLTLHTLSACNVSENDSSTRQEENVINKIISVEEFDKMSQPGVQLIDVRTAEEFSGGCIKHAVNMDVNQPRFLANLKKLDQSKPVFVYCLSGGRSAKAAEQMKELGFKEVYNLRGGIMKWQAEGRLLSNARVTSLNKEITTAEFNSKVKQKQKVIVDFYAPWCIPCKKMAPYLEKINIEDTSQLIVYKINADENKSLCKALKVEGLPVLEFYNEGKLVWRHEGLMEETELRKRIAD